jgi:hypothetical protein
MSYRNRSITFAHKIMYHDRVTLSHLKITVN